MDDLYFWDDDYSFFWSKGFVEGINLMKSAVGDQLGYGYDEAEEIFSDIDIKPPIRLLGSREANRLINEEEARRMEEKTDSLFKDPDDLEKLLDQVADLHDTSVDEVSSSWLDRQKSLERDNEGEDNSKKMSGRPIATGSWFYCSKVLLINSRKRIII